VGDCLSLGVESVVRLVELLVEGALGAGVPRLLLSFEKLGQNLFLLVAVGACRAHQRFTLNRIAKKKRRY
jgi:hypothetical protein